MLKPWVAEDRSVLVQYGGSQWGIPKSPWLFHYLTDRNLDDLGVPILVYGNMTRSHLKKQVDPAVWRYWFKIPVYRYKTMVHRGFNNHQQCGNRVDSC